MKKIFVKPIAFILGIALAIGALGLYGCGSQDTSNSGSGVTAKNQGIAQSIDRDVSIEKTTLLDIPEITITADSVSFENNQLCLNLTLTNKTSKPISATAGTLGFSANYINNYMVNDGYLAADLEANETTEKTVYFDALELQGLGITKIGEIGLGILVKNNQTSKDFSSSDYSQIAQQVVALKTNQYASADMNSNTYAEAINNQVYLAQIGGTMLKFDGNGGFNQSGISIQSIALLKNSEDEKIVLVEIQNNTNELVAARSSDVTINGEMAYEGSWTSTALAPHKIGLMAINLNDIEEMVSAYGDDGPVDFGLESISNVGIEFAVYDKKFNTVVSPVELEFNF